MWQPDTRNATHFSRFLSNPGAAAASPGPGPGTAETLYIPLTHYGGRPELRFWGSSNTGPSRARAWPAWRPPRRWARASPPSGSFTHMRPALRVLSLLTRTELTVRRPGRPRPGRREPTTDLWTHCAGPPPGRDMCGTALRGVRMRARHPTRNRVYTLASPRVWRIPESFRKKQTNPGRLGAAPGESSETGGNQVLGASGA